MKKTLAITREDNTRFMRKKYFSTGGYQVPVTCSEEETFRIVNDSKSDLIISSNHSSRRNGIEFIQKSKRDNCKVLVILGTLFNKFQTAN